MVESSAPGRSRRTKDVTRLHSQGNAGRDGCRSGSRLPDLRVRKTWRIMSNIAEAPTYTSWQAGLYLDSDGPGAGTAAECRKMAELFSGGSKNRPRGSS